MSARSQKIPVILAIILLPIAGWLAWKNYRVATGHDESVMRADVFVPQGRLKTEEHWMADETAQRIAEMLAYAKNATGKLEWSSKPINGQPHAYEFRAEVDHAPVTGSVQPKDYAWSPKDYLPWAQGLIGGWKIAAAPASAAPGDFLVKLASATPTAIQAEGKRLSAALSQQPLDATLHEQAALVIASFALREAAGDLSDTRRELSRIAAHLAIARALQPTATGSLRSLGECALQTLAGREAAALEMLASIPTETAGALSWVRALRLRNTGDWREEVDAKVLLEALEAFRARARSVDAHFARLWMEKQHPMPVHDWRRMMIERSFGVEDGHGYAKSSIQQELESITADWQTYHSAVLPENAMIKALNAPATAAVTQNEAGKASITVLGWDFWSAQHQRHLCQSMRATNKFLKELWGVPEYRDAQKFMKAKFSTLTLSLVERDLTDNPKDFDAIGEHVTALIKAQPELVGPASWSSLRERKRDNCPALAIPEPNSWFTPLFPFGTAYEIEQRSSGFPLPNGRDKWWTEMVAIAPHSYTLRFGQTWKTFGNNPPSEAAQAAYGPISDYNHLAMIKLADAQKERPDAYPAAMQKVCDIDPDFYFMFGDWYMSQEQPEKAAAVFEKGVDLGEDRVHAANKCRWLVNYLEANGSPERALAVATMAAEVYSHTGLSTMARLLENRGRLGEAESYYKKIAERYDESSDLLAFYSRQRAKDPAYEQRAVAGERKVFPSGMQRVALTDFQGTPKGGARLAGSSPTVVKAGLRQGDVLVALDGYRVENQAQYMYVRSLEYATDLKLIIWNGSAYREVTANPPDRRFGVNLSDFKPQ